MICICVAIAEESSNGEEMKTKIKHPQMWFNFHSIFLMNGWFFAWLWRERDVHGADVVAGFYGKGWVTFCQL
jgi:hypothetical protein